MAPKSSTVLSRIEVSPEELHTYPASDLVIETPQGLSISARLIRPGQSSAVVLSHGFGSDKHSRGRYDKLAIAYAALGHTVLAYDFTGFGLSSDAPIVPRRLQSDLRSVIEYLRGEGVTRIALHGHSLGTAISILVGPESAEVEAYVLTGALTGPFPVDRASANPGGLLSDEQINALASGEAVQVADLNGTGRSHFEVPAGGLADPYDGIAQHEALSALQAPALIVHGDGDESERWLLALTLSGFDALRPGSRLVVIRGADHSFIDQYDEVIEQSVAWLSRHFSAPANHDRVQLSDADR